MGHGEDRSYYAWVKRRIDRAGVGFLDDALYDRLMRKVALDGLMGDVAYLREQGIADKDIKLPLGFTPEKLAREHARITAEVQKYPEIVRALGKVPPAPPGSFSAERRNRNNENRSERIGRLVFLAWALFVLGHAWYEAVSRSLHGDWDLLVIVGFITFIVVGVPVLLAMQSLEQERRSYQERERREELRRREEHVRRAYYQLGLRKGISIGKRLRDSPGQKHDDNGLES